MNKVILRADGTLSSGYGHVIRLISVAAMLRRKYKCIFVIQQLDDFLKAEIKKVCDEVIELPKTSNLDKEASLISKKIITSNDIVVLDGYNFKEHYQSEIKKVCFKLVCIDDIHTHHFLADVIINHGEGIKAKNYSKEFYTRLYLGVEYAILRSSFLKQQQHRIDNRLEQVFINMGGTDEKNYTEKTLKTCVKIKTVKSINVVVGSFYKHQNTLQKIILANEHIDIKVHSGLTEQKMAELMKKSSFGICSASTVSYEYASVGGVLFVVKTVANQKNIYSFLMRHKVAYQLNTLNETLSQLENKKARTNYFENRSVYFSGKSTQKLNHVFEKLELDRKVTIRKATKKDLLTYFKWVNDSEVRKNSIQTDPIPLQGHTKWFTSKIKNPEASLFILEKNGIALGQVRFDRGDSSATIDYSIDKKFRGKGYGELILRNAILKFKKQFPSDQITAQVKQGNLASDRVFNNLAFTKRKSVTIKREKYNTYVLE